MEKPRKLPLHAISGTTFPIVQELPLHVCRGIGKVVSAHAVLETEVTNLLFDLAGIKYPIGRMSFRYQAASERFKLVKRLMSLHGLSAPQELPINELLDQITDCCNARDMFSHGVWVKTKEDRLALRLTKGEFKTEEGVIDRTMLPQAMFVPSDYYEATRHVILITAQAVSRLREELIAELKTRNAKS